MKRMYIGVVLFALIMLGAMQGQNVAYAKKSKITFENVEKRKLSLAKGERFKVKLDDANLDKDAELEWESSNKKVVKVSSKGKITAVKKGKAKVTVKLVELDKKATIKVSVHNFIKVKKIKTEKIDGTFLTGEVKKLETSVTPKKNDDEITYKTSNDDIATVDQEGNITAKAAGKVTITVRAKKSKKTAKRKITIRENEVKKVRFTERQVVLGLAQKKQMSLKISPSYVTDRKMNYISSNPSVVSVDENGMLQSHKVGKAEITVHYYKNAAVSDKCTVTVSRTAGQLTKAQLDKMNLRNVNNLMIVAHPDDETLFGGAHLIAGDYLVVCLTNSKDPVRSADFYDAMSIAQVKSIMLNYPDNNKDKLNYTWDYDQLSIQNDINLLLHYKKWDTIVTHNPEGDYGHYHHKRVSKFTTTLYVGNKTCAKRFMYFGKFYTKDKLTDNVKATLAKTNDELFDIKVKMLSTYESKHWTCFTWLWHIQPYENWIYYEDWK